MPLPQLLSIIESLGEFRELLEAMPPPGVRRQIGGLHGSSDTVVLAAVVTVVCLLVAYPYAHLMTIVSGRWRAVLLAVVLVPFWTSLMARTFAWVVLLQDNGIVNAFLQGIGMEHVRDHERELVGYALERLRAIPGLTLHGPSDPARRGALVSFALDGIHPHDVAEILGRQGICVRAGHHCCQPLMAKLGVVATNRASFYLYTVPEEIDQLVAGGAQRGRVPFHHHVRQRRAILPQSHRVGDEAVA